MHTISEKALSSLKGYDQAEVYSVRSTINAVYIDGSKISNAETKTDVGMSIRASKGNRMGRASVTLDSPKSVDECIRMVGDVSRNSPECSEFNGYPMPADRKVTVKGIFDNKIKNIQPSDLRDIAQAAIDSCDTDIPRGLLRVSEISSVVMNSNGVSAEHKSTMMYGHFTSMMKLDHPGEGIETIFGTSFKVDPEHIGISLTLKARSAASATPFKGHEKMTMILPPSELGDMLMSSAGSALNGENVKYQRSPWKDCMNTKVASDILTMTDDPTRAAPLCSEFDDEGTPSSKKVMIENGIIRSFMNDSFVGNSTGNGMRRSSVESQGIYENAVGIKPMNLVVSPGRDTVDSIILNTKNGIYVEKFAWPEADGLTGRFGLEVRSGHLIKNGRITGTVNNALLMGNMNECMKMIDMVGNDQRNMGCITVPTMSFDGVELIGN